MADDSTSAVELLRREVREVWDGHEAEMIRELYAPDCDVTANGHEFSSREPFQSWVAAALAAFPDLDVVSVDYVDDGTRAAAQLTWEGTHRGEIAGVPPTGTEVRVDGSVFVRATDSHIVEAWALDDEAGLLEQVGALEK